MKNKLLFALLAATLAATVRAEVKVEDAIKWRQSAYATMAWNMGRIKDNLDGQYNKDDVQKAATVIQAIANSGMGALYLPGSDKGKGWVDTRVKPEFFSNPEGVKKVAIEFNKEANELAKAAAAGDAAAVKATFGKLGATCKSCHDDFRKK